MPNWQVLQKMYEVYQKNCLQILSHLVNNVQQSNRVVKHHTFNQFVYQENIWSDRVLILFTQYIP